jgi:hypothetical protein
MRFPAPRIVLGLLLLVGLGACAQQSDPSVTIMNYLKARVASDETTLRALSCADWEQQAIIEAQSFKAMNAQLDDMTCSQSGQQDQYTVVACEGRITTTYNGETREWPLGAYRLLQEDGEWKMCGEADAP